MSQTLATGKRVKFNKEKDNTLGIIRYEDLISNRRRVYKLV